MKTKTTPATNPRAKQGWPKRFVLLLLHFALLLAVLSPALAQAQLPEDAGFREDRILVKPAAGADLAALHLLLGIEVLRAYPDMGNLQVLLLPVGSAVPEIIAIYQQSGLVEYAEPDFLVQTLVMPNDYYFSAKALWGLHNTGQSGGKSDADIDAPEAWDIFRDARSLIVAVIDTGVREIGRASCRERV